MYSAGKMILAIGITLVAVGGALLLAGKFGLPLGRLPGDITWQRKNVTVFLPLGTMLVISLLISLILNFFSRWKR